MHAPHSMQPERAGPDAAEERVRHGRAGLVAEEDADGREPEGVPDAHVVGHLGEDVVERRAVRHLRDAEHAAGLVVERRELALPLGDAGPLRVLEELARRHVERVGVDERAAADARAAQDDGVGQQVDALDAVEAEARGVEELADPPRGRRELVVGEAATGLQDADLVALLGEAQRGDRAAEAGADHEDVVVLAHRTPAFFIARTTVVRCPAHCSSERPNWAPRPISRCTETVCDSVYFISPSAP